MKWGRTNKALAKCYDQAAPDNASIGYLMVINTLLCIITGKLKAHSLKVFKSVSSYILKWGTVYRLL